MQELKTFFAKSSVKAVVIGIFTVVFGVLCNWTVGSDVWWRWLIFVAFSIVNIGILWLYAKAEKSNDHKVLELENQLAAAKMKRLI